MSILAIIPARKNSKGILGKNIIDFCGKPLIAWTILAAKNSKSIHRVVVSTDSEQIAEIALSYGAEVPFMRPAELAQDDSPGMSVILHALNWLLENESYCSDYTMALQPASPLRTSDDIDNTIDLLKAKQVSSVVSVSLVKQHPYLMKNVTDIGTMTNFYKITEDAGNRQDLPPVYILNGAIYLARSNKLVQDKSWYDEQTQAYIMPESRSIDIDTPEDLFLAGYLMSLIQSHDIDQY